MDRRTLARVGVCALAAVLAAGCSPTSAFRRPDSPGGRGKSPPDPTDNRSAPDPVARANAGGVQPAAGTADAGAVAAGGPLPGVPVPSLPQPRQADPPPGGAVNPAPVPPVPLGGQPGQPPPPGTLPGQPGGPLPPGVMPGGPPNPHLRATPTASGSRLDLAPWEVPTDRVVEITRQLESLASQNRALLSRIRELEAAGTTREQALNEALRDVEMAEAEVNRTRGVLLTVRNEAANLRQKLQQVEQEDIETLRAVIAALERLMQAQTPTGGRLP